MHCRGDDGFPSSTLYNVFSSWSTPLRQRLTDIGCGITSCIIGLRSTPFGLCQGHYAAYVQIQHHKSLLYRPIMLWCMCSHILVYLASSWACQHNNDNIHFCNLLRVERCWHWFLLVFLHVCLAKWLDARVIRWGSSCFVVRKTCEWCLVCVGWPYLCPGSEAIPSNPLQSGLIAFCCWATTGFLCCIPNEKEFVP